MKLLTFKEAVSLARYEAIRYEERMGRKPNVVYMSRDLFYDLHDQYKTLSVLEPTHLAGMKVILFDNPSNYIYTAWEREEEYGDSETSLKAHDSNV